MTKGSPVLLILFLSACLAQAQWEQIEEFPSYDFGSVIVYDSAKGIAVYLDFYGYTWTWDGNNWSVASRSGPGPISRAAAVFDSGRGRIVLFGGHNAYYEPLKNTWEWNGRKWKRIKKPGPTEREDHAMAYDAARGVTVLFGGMNEYYEDLGDTWEWDGNNWKEVSIAGPPKRSRHLMAYDQAREKIVLFGGRDKVGGVNDIGYHVNDTWEYDGASWTKVSNEVSSKYLTRDEMMAYNTESGRVMMLGRKEYSKRLYRWEWLGDRWQSKRLKKLPCTGWEEMVYDSARNQIVVFDGMNKATYEYKGKKLSKSEILWPPSEGDSLLAYDLLRSRLVLFGNQTVKAKTYEWDGAKWTVFDSRGPSHPDGRFGAAMVYNSELKQCFYFGGQSAAMYEEHIFFNDTWGWDGKKWKQLSSSGPEHRANHAMAYDSDRGVVVLFGGDDVFSSGSQIGYFADTWEWQNGSWTKKSDSGPSARTLAAIAYDEGRKRTVLFGGMVEDNYTKKRYRDTWEWDGSIWTKVAESGPKARSEHSLVYDPELGKTILFGGVSGSDKYYLLIEENDLWTWDGSSWKKVKAKPAPLGRYGHGATYDTKRKAMVFFGGFAFDQYMEDMWYYGIKPDVAPDSK